MTDDISKQRRGLAAAFLVCALASLTLLANHPGGNPGSFADLIKDEAAHQVIDGVVHGGFVITLGALIICFSFCLACWGQRRAQWSLAWSTSAPVVLL